MAPQNLLLPMKVDAFVFNGPVCNGKGDRAKIAPITQPDYTFLQLENHLALNDILKHVDLHNSAPTERNPRYMDIGKATVRKNRVGVYLHWTIPRPFRSGSAETEKTTTESSTLDGNNKPCDENGGKDPSAIKYPALPNRWLVIRSFDPKAATTIPKEPPGMKAVTAWIIESDKTMRIDNISDSVDLEVDVAPFITSYVPGSDKKGDSLGQEKSEIGDISVARQAEIFIGSCTEAARWKKMQQEPEETDQRVNLTVASSSNQLFIDYQYHCGNVFSMLDTFSYTDNGQTKNLHSVVADYYVVGWQDDPNNDIMGSLGGDPTRGDRLNTLRVSINKNVPTSDEKDIEHWMLSPETTSTLCHGAMYDVVWRDDQAPDICPADQLAKKMTETMPFSVGSTPVDALLAYIGARSPSGSVEQGILRLQNLLRAEDEGVDAQVAAEDEIQSYNYAHFDGGNHFYLPAQEGKNAGASPAPEEQMDIRRTNNAQHLVDSIRRRIQQLRWDVFSWWWKFISNIDNQGPHISSIRDTQDTIKELQRSAAILQERIGQPQAPIKMGVMEAFHQRNDPTLVIAGLEAGWPVDFNDSLAGRLDNQTLETGSPVPDDAQLDCIPKPLRDSASSLVLEFLSLKNKDAQREDRLPPLYHDGKLPSKPAGDGNPWRDRWGCSQPWSPLYLEWEAEYAHITFDRWSMRKREAREGISSKFGFVLKEDVRFKHTDRNRGYQDVRYVSGRSLVLPQPAFSLKVHIDRLFSTIPPIELDILLSPQEREDLVKKLDRLAILSVPLGGLTDHLTTRYQGSHIKPLVRQPGMKPVVLNEASDMVASKGVDLSLIDQESDPTPYGSLSTLVGHTMPGFKPATHGQLRFTKINIIDKFGQVVHAIDPLPEDPPAIYPTVGEFYAIDGVPNDPGQPNVVDPSRSTLKAPEYIQLPPAINQPARINAHFIVSDEDVVGVEGKWRPATEFDEPIWGWVVINYVDQGLQFFLPNGTFYREIRTTKSDIAWIPFPKSDNPIQNEQLDTLVKQLVSSPKYLRAFMDMIMSALQNTVPTPSAYSQFLNSLVGRPLALANMGWSLELNADSKKNESTVNDQLKAPRDWGLLDGDAERTYSFPLKLGDASANYDGLVGYFKFTGKKQDPENPKDEKRKMDVSRVFTYFHTKSGLDSNPLAPIDEASYIQLQAFWEDPKEYKIESSNPTSIDILTGSFERARNKRLEPIAAIFDPFAPITGYTGILPIRKLTLPSWTWESALKRITTFFHAGPLVMAENVPDFDSQYKLEKDSYELDRTFPGTRLSMPALQTADWAWLQPYDVGSTSEPLAYMSLDVVGDADEKPKWKSGPLTAVEGFMQLKKPIERPSTD